MTDDIDFLMRFECLRHDFRSVCHKTGIPHSPLPRINRSNRRHYKKYYDHELEQVVRDKFIDEITLGNYSFESG